MASPSSCTRSRYSNSGGDSLTFRALGARLGVDATAVYRHFADKDELILELVDRLLKEAMAGFTPDDNWRKTIVDIYERVRAVHLKFPRLAVLVASRTGRRAHEFSAVEHIIGALRRAGLSPESAGRYYRVLTEYVLGYMIEEATFRSLDAATQDGDRRAWLVEYRALPDDEFPNIASSIDHIPIDDDPRIFGWGLDLLLDAVEQQIQAPPPVST